MTNSDYALKNMAEFNELCHNEEFMKYASPIYDYFEVMPHGKIIRLKADEKHLPWLIAVACGFLMSGNHWSEYDFNEDMTKFRRL